MNYTKKVQKPCQNMGFIAEMTDNKGRLGGVPGMMFCEADMACGPVAFNYMVMRIGINLE